MSATVATVEASTNIYDLAVFFLRPFLKVVWATYQITSTISWNLSVTFPQPFSSFLSLLSFLQLDFLSLVQWHVPTTSLL